MELEGLRASIDDIDKRIIDLFEKRMEVSKIIAQVKKESGKAIFDAKREKDKIDSLKSILSDKENEKYVEDLYRHIFDYSKDVQQKVIDDEK